MTLNTKIDMVVPTKFNRLCKLCSYRSIEKKQYGKVSKKGVVNSKTFQSTDNGLVCSQCNGLTCQECMKLLIPVLKKDAHKHVNTHILDAYVSAVRMLPSDIVSPPNYVGHCCNIKSNVAETASANSLEEVLPRSSSIINPTSLSSSDARLSGCIYFPEFDLFIDSPVRCTDIHAVGAESHAAEIKVTKKRKRTINTKKTHNLKSSSLLRARKGETYLPARWHCVISDSHARHSNMFTPASNGPVPANWRMKLLSKVKINMPHNDKAEKVRIIILIELLH